MLATANLWHVQQWTAVILKLTKEIAKMIIWTNYHTVTDKIPPLERKKNKFRWRPKPIMKTYDQQLATYEK